MRDTGNPARGVVDISERGKGQRGFDGRSLVPRTGAVKKRTGQVMEPANSCAPGGAHRTSVNV